MVILTKENFQSEVLNALNPVLVIFGAQWDPNSTKIQEWAAKLETNIKIGYVDIDNSSSTAVNFSIRGVPTVALFEKGKIVESVFGKQLTTETGFLEILK